MRREQWPPWEISSLEAKLDQLAAAVETPGDRPIEEQAWLTRFLVIRACGYLEQVVHETVRSFLTEKSFGMARSFSLSWLARSKNPSPNNLLEIVARLDSSMRDELYDLLEQDAGALHRQLSLLLDRRHQIAHGLSEGVNSRKALELVLVSKTLADWFILRFNPYSRANGSGK